MNLSITEIYNLQKFNVLFLLQVPGLVNVDFADVRAIMQNAGSSLMGIGTATGITSEISFWCFFVDIYMIAAHI